MRPLFFLALAAGLGCNRPPQPLPTEPAGGPMCLRLTATPSPESSESPLSMVLALPQPLGVPVHDAPPGQTSTMGLLLKDVAWTASRALWGSTTGVATVSRREVGALTVVLERMPSDAGYQFQGTAQPDGSTRERPVTTGTWWAENVGGPREVGTFRLEAAERHNGACPAP